MANENLLSKLIQTGRIFFAIGIIAYGVQQLVIRDFRPEILPPFPAWAHEHFIFPLITGIALILAGIIISGLFKVGNNLDKKVCLWLGTYFLALIILCQIPYCLFLNPMGPMHLSTWVPSLKGLAYSGGAFVIAGSIGNFVVVNNKPNSILEKLIPAGRIFFAIMLILYGSCHFIYTGFVSQMVPQWFGLPVFWTYFAGTALMGAGICILFRIFIKTIATLLSIMIFIWFIVLHVPGAITHPYLAHGNEIVSAFDALLFSGVAFVIGHSDHSMKSSPNYSNSSLEVSQ